MKVYGRHTMELWLNQQDLHRGTRVFCLSLGRSLGLDSCNATLILESLSKVLICSLFHPVRLKEKTHGKQGSAGIG